MFNGNAMFPLYTQWRLYLVGWCTHKGTTATNSTVQQIHPPPSPVYQSVCQVNALPLTQGCQICDPGANKARKCVFFSLQDDFAKLKKSIIFLTTETAVLLSTGYCNHVFCYENKQHTQTEQVGTSTVTLCWSYVVFLSTTSHLLLAALMKMLSWPTALDLTVQQEALVRLLTERK